jgi:transcription termination factor NusB
MEWAITLNEEEQYAEIVSRGVADKDGSLAIAKAISTALNKIKITRILIDHRNIIEVSGSAIEIYYRPKELKEIGMVQKIKLAEVVKEEHKSFFKFFETVCVNSGYRFSIFYDRKPALEWLLNL